MKKCCEAINELPCFGCLSLLVEHSGKSGWNLKRFEYFTSISHSFSQMMFGFCCCFFYLSASQCEAGKIRKYFFFHVHKCFRYRITIPKNYTTRMSITGRQSFCIRAAPALFSEELMYAIRSEWFFPKPVFPPFLMQMELLSKLHYGVNILFRFLRVELSSAKWILGSRGHIWNQSKWEKSLQAMFATTSHWLILNQYGRLSYGIELSTEKSIWKWECSMSHGNIVDFE